MDSRSGFDELVVYQRAMAFVMSIYGLISAFPADDKPQLVSMAKDAAVAITSAISSMAKKESVPQKRYSGKTALNAVEDCRMYLEMVMEHGLADTSDLRRQLDEVTTLIKEYLTYL